MRRVLGLLAVVLAFGLLKAPPALAQADLTGTYFGKMSCKGLDANGDKETIKKWVLAIVSQPQTNANGADLQVITETIDPDTGAVIDLFGWFGNAIFDAGKPDQKGVGVLNECTHLVTPQSTYQMVSFTYSVSPGSVKGSLKLTTIGDFTGTNGSISQCKGALKRVDTMDLGVPFCP